ncbi:hypothetical protein VPHD148_0321 [Vibrio phage D148]
MNKFKVIVGDESNDGHGQWDIVYFTTNFSNNDLQAAMLEAKRQLKEPFDNLFNDYEDSTIPSDLVEELKTHGWELPHDCEEYEGRHYVICHDGMVRFFMSVLQTFTNNLEYNIVSDSTEEFSFPSSGYGLYH